MFAVVKAGGKEYKISEGDIIRVDRLDGNVGDRVTLKDVLMVCQEGDIRVGNPYLSQVAVTGEIVQQTRGKKILVFKMKRRKNYRRLKGHRQQYTYLRVNEISLA